MRRDPGARAFEIHCQRCRVSFPVGTRQCVHCGERLGRPGPRRAAALETRAPGAAPPPPDELADEELQTRSGVMSPVAILWIVLLLGGAIYRACA